MPPFPEGEGSLTIERRWVDRLLPEWELLAACEYAFGQISAVLATAHHETGVAACDLPTRDRARVSAALKFPLRCMCLESDTREAYFDLGTQAPLELKKFVVEHDPDTSAMAEKRYGDMTLTGDAIARVPQAFEMGKRVLSADGFIAQVAWLLQGERLIDVQLPVFFSQAAKRLSMNVLALRVKMLNADGFLYLTESWLAPAPSPEKLKTGEYLPARAHPDRVEDIQSWR